MSTVSPEQTANSSSANIAKELKQKLNIDASTQVSMAELESRIENVAREMASRIHELNIGDIESVLNDFASNHGGIASIVQRTIEHLKVKKGEVATEAEDVHKEAVAKVDELKNTEASARAAYLKTGDAKHLHTINKANASKASVDTSGPTTSSAATAAPAPSMASAASSMPTAMNETTTTAAKVETTGDALDEDGDSNRLFTKNKKETSKKSKKDKLNALKKKHQPEKNKTTQEKITRSTKKDSPLKPEQELQAQTESKPIAMQPTESEGLQIESAEAEKLNVKPQEEVSSKAKESDHMAESFDPGITQNNSENKPKKGFGRFLNKIFGKKKQAEEAQKASDENNAEENTAIKEEYKDHSGHISQSRANYLGLAAQRSQENGGVEVPEIDSEIAKNAATQEANVQKD